MVNHILLRLYGSFDPHFLFGFDPMIYGNLTLLCKEVTSR